MVKITLLFVCGLIFAFATQAATIDTDNSTITFWAGGGGNTIPFDNYVLQHRGGPYQQLYAGSSFGGPVTLTGISFPLKYFTQSTDATRIGLTAYLISTDVTVGTMHDNFWDNYGPDFWPTLGGALVKVFDGTVTVPSEPSEFFNLDIDFTKPYHFSPENGRNLLLELGVWSSSCHCYVQAGITPEMSRSYWYLGSNGGDHQYGLATQFTYAVPAGQVPEPATFVLIGAGLIGMAGIKRRR